MTFSAGPRAADATLDVQRSGVDHRRPVGAAVDVGDRPTLNAMTATTPAGTVVPRLTRRRAPASLSSGLPVDVVDPVDLFGIGLDGGQV